jgi:1-acyl-sn-glycerol-3-phosphate acyltransferase
MNIQPYRTPDSFWPPKMSRWWFRLVDPLRVKALREQRIESIEIKGFEHIQQSLDANAGILLAPNHSFHWDSYCLLETARRAGHPFFIMTAWQVFHQSSRFERFSMQRCGCFSVDREGTDMAAIKTAVDILQNKPFPLVVFPEGDVYHTNDRVTLFRDGAAAMALLAARKSQRDIVVIPVAIKRWYTADPHESLEQTLSQVEDRLFWRPKKHLSLQERIISIANALLSLKELEYYQSVQTGSLADRIQTLANRVLSDAEIRYAGTASVGSLPERVKEIRRRIIQLQSLPEISDAEMIQYEADMQSMFFVTQLYSYPGDYLIQKPSVERIAETIDKFEEDVLGAPYPSVHGPKSVTIEFAPPIRIPKGKENKLSAADLTKQMQFEVQRMLDELNEHHDFKGKLGE